MIRTNIELLKSRISQIVEKCRRPAESVRLVAVSKRFPAQAIEEAQRAGQMIFGENYLQEAQEKHEQLQGNVQFHFIGHLQSNKVATAADICTMIETVDRLKLAKLLHQHLHKRKREIDILIQVNIGADPKKQGVDVGQAASLLREIAALETLRPRGLMTMPPLSEDPEDSRIHFRNLRLLAERLAKEKLFYDNSAIELSMGMSNDYPIAIEEGATLVRIGTAIFGQRPSKI